MTLDAERISRLAARLAHSCVDGELLGNWLKAINDGVLLDQDTMYLEMAESMSKLAQPILEEAFQEILGDRHDGICPRCGVHEDELRRLRAKISDRREDDAATARTIHRNANEESLLKGRVGLYRMYIERAHVILDGHNVPLVNADTRALHLHERLELLFRHMIPIDQLFKKEVIDMDERMPVHDVVAAIRKHAEATADGTDEEKPAE